MEFEINNPKIKDSYEVPTSKSIYHRALILSCFKDRDISLIGKVDSDDVYTTIECLNLLGARIKETNDGVLVSPIKKIDYQNVLDCKDSASTYRFLKEVFPDAKLTGSSNLLSRVDSNVTSQTYSGKLLRKEIFNDDFDYSIPNVSKAYIDITNKVIEDFRNVKDTYVIEKDFSSAALFLTLGAITNKVSVKGLNTNSIQGDKEILNILKEIGAVIEIDKDVITVKKDKNKRIILDGSKTPDLVPILGILLSTLEGVSEINNIGYLRYKESNRILSTKEMINSLGGECYSFDDKLVINGVKLKGGKVKTYNDHRIAMAAVISSFITEDKVVIDDINCVNKSYRSFFENIR